MWGNNHKIIINHPWLGMAPFTPISRYLQISPDISRPKWVSREPPGANLQGSPRQGDALEVCGRWTCLRQVFGIKRCHMALSKHEVYDKLAIFKIICSWGGWWKFVDEIWCSGCMPRIFRQSQFISGWWFGSFWIIWIIFHFIYGMSSFPLTNSIIFQDGHIAPPTRYII